MGYLILLGSVLLAGMLGVKVSEVAGRVSNSTVVAALTSFALYSGLLVGGCWLIMPPPMPQGGDPQTAELNARVYSQTVRQIITLGVFFLLVGGSICVLAPIVQGRHGRFRKPLRTDNDQRKGTKVRS